MRLSIMKMKIILVGFLLLSSQPGASQSQEKIYAVMMLNFAKGMQWPAAYSKGDVVIGVFGYPPLVAEMRSTLSKVRINNRTVRVKEYSSIDEIESVHMLFVPAFKARSFESIVNKVTGSPTLLITNKPGYARKGAGVNFLFLNGTVKYELNASSVESRGTRVSSNVKGLGIIVD